MGWLTGWAERVKLTADSAVIDEDLVNFPALLYVGLASGKNAKDLTFVFDEVGANSKKIAVTKSDGTTECYVEIERWDLANEKAWLWAKHPTLNGTVDEDYYLYFDNTHADNTTYVGDVGSTPAMNVWDSNFKQVWHLNTTSWLNSVSGGVNGTSYGDPAVVDSKIGKGVDLDGNDAINLADANSQSTWTVEGFLKKHVNTAGSTLYDRAGNTHQFFMNDETRLCYYSTTGGQSDAVATFSNGQWIYFAYTYDGSMLKIYTDTAVSSFTRSVASWTTAAQYIGSWQNTAFMDGDIDELRISDIARSVAWLKASLNSGNDSLWTWGNMEAFTTYYQTITANARVKKTQSQTINGNACIVLRHYETIAANARVKVPVLKTISGTARVKKTFAQTTTGNATVVFREYETINANARVRIPISKIVEGNARIVVTQLKTITGTARVKVPISQTVAGVARVKVPISQTTTGNARVKATISKTISGNALVCFRYYKTITGKGYTESIQYYNTPLSYRFDRENRARAIGGVANSIGREWWVNSDSILCFYERRGHDKSATVTLGDDITVVDQSFDASKIIDKLTVIGMGPGSSHLEVTVGTGVMEGVFSEKDIHDIDTLTAFANAALEQTKEAKHRMLVTLAGTERTDFELGDTVRVTYADAGIDGNYRIISMGRVSGTDGEYTELEITVPQFRVTETLADAERRVDATDYHPQGAPSIITHDRAENVDSTHPMSLKFYIPEEAVDMGKLQIKEARVALVLEPFRAHSTGAASGGGQTTSSGGGQTTSSGGGQTSSGGSSHSHSISGQTAQTTETTMQVSYIDTFTKYCASTSGGATTYQFLAPYTISYYQVAGALHTHAVSGATSSSESSHTHSVSNHTHTVSNHTHSVSDHTHSIVYGIYTSTSPANVYIKLNGTQIAGPYNTDSFIDITGAFLAAITTYGWNTLEFTSAQLGKIAATLFMRLFLQAS